jgi:transposase
MHLLHALEQAEAPVELKDVASVQMLRQVWQQYYDLSSGKAKWRAGPQESSDEGIIRSPYDPEARTGKKREMTWLGYKVHLTETCALDATEDAQARAMPQLIVEVQTTMANVQDVEMTATIQEKLAQHHLLPEEQIVDTGYVDADLLVSSQQPYGIRLVGPVLSDNSWQAKAGKGFDLAHFQIDWHQKLATCPQGQTSSRALRGRGADGSRVCPRGLCLLSCSQRLYSVADDGARAASASASGAFGTSGTTTGTADVGVSAAVCHTSRH